MDNVTAENYECNNAKQFCNDMIDNFFNVEHYHGRNMFQGPAVRCENIQDVLSNTKVKCQFDNMGKRYIVYPVKSAKLKE